MTKDDNQESGMEQMFDMWEKGQEAFLKAQTEAIDTFNKSRLGPKCFYK